MVKKKEKLKTPDWILQGYDSKADYEKAKGISSEKKKRKVFKLKKCPSCGSNDVKIVLGKEEGEKAEEWECKNCKWKGKDVDEEEMGEEEFMNYLDEKDGREG